uniref:Uncharacterized protein n=1 Tax=Arundo donax TaxID=35708 RepID=A0A0A8XQN5_ARUDO
MHLQQQDVLIKCKASFFTAFICLNTRKKRNN